MCVLLFMQRTCCWFLTCVKLSLQSTLAMTREMRWVRLSRFAASVGPKSSTFTSLCHAPIPWGLYRMVQQFQERTDGEMMVNSVDLEHMMIKSIKRLQGYPSFRLTHFGPTMTKWSFLSPGFFGMLDFLPFQNVSSKFCRLAFGFINLQEIWKTIVPKLGFAERKNDKRNILYS